ncbi:hypothetical protein [Methanooceanicella nereidis]|uniref:hypothetical protein n=1 Tax=Methanooceanicella nereidis TaxID=2052831 RepID=UPI001E2E9816|nr:hypothetical protein [Methanocella sp. CWC-04]
MEIKFSLDENSGKVKDFTISGSNTDFGSDVLAKVIRSIKESLEAQSTPAPGPSVMSKDIADLSKDKLTIKERLKLFLKFEYRSRWFNTIDVKERYGRQYGEEIKLSTVSTYLSRLHSEGFLERRGNRVSREYRILDEIDEGSQLTIAEKSDVPPLR